VKKIVLISTVLALSACNQKSQPAGPEKHYQLTGKIVGLDAQHQTATIDAAAIPNFMDAMTMDYPIKSKSEFQSLKAGEEISATINVASDESYTVTDIKPRH
jgi:Cu/Ag efflux protein CusF